MNARTRYALLFVALCCAAVVGCSAKSNRGTVSGNVTLDGQPLKSGIIHFVPADGRTTTADATIAGGKFTATMPPGDKRVTISAPNVIGQRKMYETADSPVVDVTQELLPARYNLQSDMRFSVQAGSQSKDYDLTSNK